MIVHTMEQRTPEWHEVKRGVVGGTLSGGLYVNSDTLLTKIIKELTETDFEDVDKFVSRSMQQGIDREPEARAELSRAVFVKFEEVGFLQNSELPILGISPDGTSENRKIQCELKCPEGDKHTATIIADKIPKDNRTQVIHAFAVNPDLEINYFASFRPESDICPLWYKEVRRETEMNLGTEKTPKIKTVQQWVDIALDAARKLTIKRDETMKLLTEKYT